MRRRHTRFSLLCPLTLIAACTAFSSAALAEEVPDINYGMWETTTVSSMTSEMMNVPPTSTTTSTCVTQEDVMKGQAFLDDQENCEILEREMTSNSLDMTMVCSQPQVGDTKMTVSMQYDGDTMTGRVDGELESPMGKMTMLIEMDGKRTGDC